MIARRTTGSAESGPSTASSSSHAKTFHTFRRSIAESTYAAIAPTDIGGSSGIRKRPNRWTRTVFGRDACFSGYRNTAVETYIDGRGSPNRECAGRASRSKSRNGREEEYPLEICRDLLVD